MLRAILNSDIYMPWHLSTPMNILNSKFVYDRFPSISFHDNPSFNFVQPVCAIHDLVPTRIPPETHPNTGPPKEINAILIIPSDCMLLIELLSFRLGYQATRFIDRTVASPFQMGRPSRRAVPPLCLANGNANIGRSPPGPE